jgi:uncharacterized tellurite resistance protein B-like protein
MIDLLKTLFQGAQDSGSSAEDDLQFAVYVILLEAAHSDQDFDADEETHIGRLMQQHFNLTDDDLVKLKQRADEVRQEITDLFEFTRTIKQQYGHDQREQVLEMLWQVIFADGKVDKHEEHICRRVAKLLGLPHEYYMRAKTSAMKKSDS